MKKAGYMMIIIAFMGGALMTSLDPRSLPWSGFIPLLVFGFGGLWLVKREHHSAARSDHKLGDDIAEMSLRLERIVDNLESLAAKKNELPTYEARFEIDRLFREDLDAFAEIRESMQHKFGLRQYADIMSAFAAGERYINRVWTASTDGYVDEVIMYLDKAAAQLHEAKEKFNAAKTAAQLG